MGRSSHEQALLNRAKILQCASRLFREFGVEHISVADIMSAAGMTTGGFYKHFESKDALVQEAFALAFEQASASWHRVSGKCDRSGDHDSAAIVRHYFRKRPREQTCPMLAFAPHVTDADTGNATQAIY